MSSEIIKWLEEPIKEHIKIIETLISILKKRKLDFASISLLYKRNSIGQDRALLSPVIPKLPKAIIKSKMPPINVKIKGTMTIIFNSSLTNLHSNKFDYYEPSPTKSIPQPVIIVLGGRPVIIDCIEIVEEIW